MFDVFLTMLDSASKDQPGPSGQPFAPLLEVFEDLLF
jgi:hypothetical protein